MRILHIVPGLDEPGNGISVAARLVASEHGSTLVDAAAFSHGRACLDGIDEAWVHSCWSPAVVEACFRVLREGVSLVRMTHANLDPVRLAYHGWKKWLAGFAEKPLLRRSSRIVATCVAEMDWIKNYLGKRCPKIEVIDLKRFFDLDHVTHEVPLAHLSPEVSRRSLHLLYLGRRHPLKGVEYLEAAVADVVSECRSSNVESKTPPIELRIVSDAFGEEKQRVWEWCDVLVLPTLSENFGLVVAEALEKGKAVITTDGAPAWEPEECGNVEMWKSPEGRLIYLKGYREGTSEKRAELLKNAILAVLGQSHNLTIKQSNN